MRHKHYDVIVAWAAGEEIEVKQYFANGHEGPWEPFKGEDAPFFNSWRYEYRVKPKIAKKCKGWALMSRSGQGGPLVCTIYDDIIEAGYVRQRLIREGLAPDFRIVQISWEEEI